MKLDITDINNAFSPAHEIDDPNKFIGRYEEIESLISGLSTDGSFISIFGLRGIGKSSIARQIKLIAEGNTILVRKLGLDYLVPKKGFDYMVHLVSCDSFIKDVTSLIKRILLGDDKNESIFNHNKNGDKRVVTFKQKTKALFSANLYAVKGGVEGEDETTYEPRLTDDLIQEFKQALSTTQKDNQDKTGLFILIDEFDILKDKEGFASLVKTCSSKFVKFGVVGIGETTEDLIEDHASVGRQITSVLVKPMQEKELRQIILSAVNLLKKKITFEESVIHDIIKQAEGFPYFVHLLGKESIFLAFKRKLECVCPLIYKEVLDNLIGGKIQLTQEFRYAEVCRTSPEREFLLKLFAYSENNVILIEDIYKNARDLGIDEPSQYMKQLIESKNITPVLIKSRDGRHVRFADPILKIYAKKRSFIHGKYE